MKKKFSTLGFVAGDYVTCTATIAPTFYQPGDVFKLVQKDDKLLTEIGNRNGANGEWRFADNFEISEYRKEHESTVFKADDVPEAFNMFLDKFKGQGHFRFYPDGRVEVKIDV